MRRGQHRRLRFRQVFIERDDLVTATTLERMGSIVFVAQEILQRAEEKSAKPSLLPIRAAQRILREQMSEEPLDKILRIRGVVSSMAQKSIKWRPISFAKSSKRLLRRFRKGSSAPPARRESNAWFETKRHPLARFRALLS